MLILTKMKRSFIIDHVMPSDLDKDDIKNGLKIKEEMLAGITDDYIKEITPDWKEKERYYRIHGLSDYIDKINCGEMSITELPKHKPINFDVWIRYKDFDINDYNSDPQYGRKDYDYPPLDPTKPDIVPRNGYCNWIKQNSENTFILKKPKDGEWFMDTVFQMQIVIYGDNHRRYHPYQDYKHSNGWYSITPMDKVSIYDFEAGIDSPFYRLFFRNKKGYADNVTYNGWNWEDVDWFKLNYPKLVDSDNNVHATTLLCDPFRINYKHDPKSDTDEFKGTFIVLNGRQWLRIKYPTEMVTYCPFILKINNTTTELGDL